MTTIEHRAEELKARQRPVKDTYREAPQSAVVTMRASGVLGAETISCNVNTGRAMVEAGLHPAAAGEAGLACSGDMLLEALVACAGVTLAAVATALAFDLRGGTVSAEGDLDFRGTLGVDANAPVGFREIRVSFDLDTDEPADRVETLLRLTDRYCVVGQTISQGATVEMGTGVGSRSGGLSAQSASPEGEN
ncbi:MAG: OsmC family protein [Geodermatophilaceae bacterium]|nr:OsmC family protein [Geodermatophilaceae bacterium]